LRVFVSVTFGHIIVQDVVDDPDDLGELSHVVVLVSADAVGDALFKLLNLVVFLKRGLVVGRAILDDDAARGGWLGL